MSHIARRLCMYTLPALHINLTNYVSRNSAASACILTRHSTTTVDDPSGNTRRAEINRLLYRARQRGWLELDLLVGIWAERHAHALTAVELQDFYQLLDEENPDLFKWLTGQAEPSPEILGNKAFQMIRKDVASQLKDNMAQTRSGRDWVRGWDDWKRPES